ncbi:MAG TPA: cytochrome c peroxidase [Acidimicrobiia bacterium]|jgi:cytochrome c peroxidase|nr:cytochrome c peroxidase [Acidimicrobiia bacterium]
MRPRWPWLLVVPLATAVAVLAVAWNTDSARPASAASVLGPVPIPADNPQTAEKVALGKLLFFDPRLSSSNTVACATCHQPSEGMSDGLARPRGVNGELPRNSMTVWNTAYMRALHYDGNRASLEEQADKAIPGFAMGQPYPALLEELGAIPEYKDRFSRVFPDGITEANITKAIAAFERTLLTYRSPFDRYRAGDKHALSAEQKEGMDLFFSARTACSSCHAAPLFTDNAWHNLGVPQVGTKAVDNGRADVTKNAADTGAFKTPMLRNIELTGPYMHDGVFSTLAEVVAFYAGGGGPGPNKSPLVKPLDLNAKEQKALVAFLRSLTDPTAQVEVPRLP